MSNDLMFNLLPTQVRFPLYISYCFLPQSQWAASISCSCSLVVLEHLK